MHNGLSWNQASKALRELGPNQIPQKKFPVINLVLNQFNSPFIIVLFIAAIISIIIGNFLESLIIFMIVGINTVFGFKEQYTAVKSYLHLKKQINQNVLVLRNGKKMLIDKENLVPQDICFYKRGDVICADSYIIETNNLGVDESNITGKDTVIYKKINRSFQRDLEDCIVYSGSYVIEGDCTVKVFNTGINTRIAEITKLSNNIHKKSEYEQNLKNISNRFLILSILAVITIFVLNYLFKDRGNINSLLIFTIAISITIIPKSLPLVANLTLAKSAIRLGKQNVIVKNNSAIEDLGNIDIICTDKTGTITKNKLLIDSFSTNINDQDFFSYVNLSTVESLDPLDICIQKFLSNKGVLEETEFLLEEIPFDSENRYSIRRFKDFEIIKGSPEYILKISGNTNNNVEIIEQKSNEGLRPISFAVKENGNTKYIGSLFFYDEITDGIEDVIKQALKFGLKIKVITGDSLEVSTFVSKKIGLINDSGGVILADNLDFSNKKRLAKQLEENLVFARCTPDQKFKIIKALQLKHSVGYIGDGINDAPSLALANVGIAVDSATDIAKEQADIVLLNNDLEVIINGIVEGRKCFENIENYVRFSLAANMGGFITIGILSIFLNYLPLLPIQIFIANLLIDFPLLTFYNNQIEKELVKKPKHHNLNKTLSFALIFGIISSIFDLIFFFIFKDQTPATVQTLWFSLSVITEISILFIFSNKIKKNMQVSNTHKLALLSIIITLVLTVFGLGNEFKGVPLLLIIPVLLLTLTYFLVIKLLKKPIDKLFGL